MKRKEDTKKWYKNGVQKYMKKTRTIKQSERLAFWLIIFSIACLALISLFPWIKVTETQYIQGDLYFNFEMMLKSNNYYIREIAGQLESINAYLWALIILGLASLIGGIIHSSRKLYPMGEILLIVGTGMVFSSFMFLDTLIKITKSINSTYLLQAAELFPHFNYSLILLIVSIVMLICASLYVCFVVLHLINKIKDYIKEKKKKNKQDIDIEILAQEAKQDDKNTEIEKWLSGKIKNSNNKKNQDNVLTDKKEIKEPDEENDNFPFNLDENKDEKDEDEDLIKKDLSKSFDEVFGPNVKNDETEEKQLETEEDPIKEDASLKNNLNVRCPKCKEIFEIQQNSSRIKCKYCGKEGNIKN